MEFKDEFTLHGIKLQSRRNVDFEIECLCNFVIKLSLLQLEKYIESAFYDSKHSFCYFIFNEKLFMSEAVKNKIFECAEKTIYQFQWINDCIYYGEDLFEAL